VTARVGASRLVTLGLALMLGACATVAGTPSSYGPLVARHREKALKLERSGDLRRALDEWQIALTLEPHNAAAREGQARLEARLQRALASRLRQGQEALRRGAQLEARRNFLAALALDPGNKVAFETLRDRVKEIHFVSHTVARGETLASIADRYYGDRLRSEVIWEMNQLSSRPKAGSQLKIPEIPGVPFRTAALQRTAAARRLEPTRPEPTRPEPTRPEPTPQEPKRAEPAQPEPTQPEPPDAEPAQPEPPAPAAEAEESAREELTTESNPLLVDTREALERKEYDVALLYPWREWFLTFEGAGVTAASETAYYAVPELVWKPGKHLELLVAVPVGLTGAAADYGVIAGITVEIERLTGRGEDAD